MLFGEKSIIGIFERGLFDEMRRLIFRPSEYRTHREWNIRDKVFFFPPPFPVLTSVYTFHGYANVRDTVKPTN